MRETCPDRLFGPACRAAGLCLLAALLVAGGCRTRYKVGNGEGRPITDILRIDDGVAAGAAAESPQDNRPIRGEDEVLAERPKIDLPSRNLIPPRAPERPLPYSFSAEMLRGVEEPDKQVELSMTFDNEDLAFVVKQMAETLDFTYYLDPAVGGKLTFEVHTEMTRAEAWELFVKLLWFNDAYITREKGYVRIMSMEKMPRHQRLFVDDADPRPNIMARVVRFRNVLATDMAPLIMPYLSPKASVTPLPHLNSLVIVDTPDNMYKLDELVRRLDQMGESDWPQDSIACHFTDVDVVVEELKLVLPILGLKVAAGEKADPLSVRLVPLSRLQAIIVTAPHVDVLQEVRRWVEVLDRQESGEKVELFAYEAKHTKANDLADALRFFFNSQVVQAKREAGDEGGEAAAEGQLAPKSAAPGGNNGASAAIRQSVYETPASVFVDGGHNRLVIRTTSRVHARMLALLESLDTPPYQVLVQMSIAEIQLNKDTRYGFRYSALNEIHKGKYDLVSRLDPDSSGTAATPGLNLVFTEVSDPTRVFAFIEAVAGQGNTRVLFSPQVLAISDEQASINVGDKVPIVTQENNEDDSTNITRQIQYQDTGIIMTITPHVTGSKMVTLKIKQEVSDAVQTTSSNIDSPTIQSRVVETSLLVRDNTTILLGGLIRTRDIYNDTGIPLLKDIPGVGRLFALTTKEEQRLELLLLITVNVVDMDADVERLTKRYQAAVQAIRDKLDPTKQSEAK